MARQITLLDIYVHDEVLPYRIGTEGVIEGATHYKSALKDTVTYSQRMPLDGGPSFKSFGQAEIRNADASRDGWLLQDPRRVVMRVGWNYQLVSEYAVYELQASGWTDGGDNTIKLSFSDLTQALKKPLCSDEYTAGDADGSVPFCAGRNRLVPAVLIDESAREYQIHGYGSVQDVCEQLYVDGDVSGISVTKSNASGTFTLASDPGGEVSVRCRGVGGAYTTIGEIAEDVITQLGLTVEASSLTALKALLDYDAGIYVSDKTEAFTVLSDLLSPHGVGFGSNDNEEIVFYMLAVGGTPVKTIKRHREGSLRVNPIHPIHKIHLGYRKHYTTATNGAGLTQSEISDNGKEYRFRHSNSLATETDYQNAREVTRNTAIYGSGNALTEAQRQRTMFNTLRNRYETVSEQAEGLRVGDFYTLIHPRHGLQSGKVLQLVKLEKLKNQRQFRIEGWG